jgi:ATP-dependent RNA helicase RhlB
MTEEPESQEIMPRSDKPKFLTKTRFSDLNLPKNVLAGLDDAGFVHCTPIQEQVLPISLNGKDVAGQAQTGTGKTAAFLVTVLARLIDQPRKNKDLPAALVVAPTRELAYQIYDEAMALGRHTKFEMVRVVGGVDYQKQADVLKTGPEIVICTPGRIIDYYKQKIFRPQGIHTVVIDEADRLLDLGFAKDMRFILSKLPHYEKRQSMLFSATLSFRVMELTYEYMNLPEFVAVTPEEATVDGIQQVLYHVGNESKLPLLLGLLNREDWGRMLIFANTKAGVEWLSQKLKGNGWPAEGITGDLPQKKRFQLMEKFKNGKIKILIATDVASRGIHVEDISHVINYDLPQDAENYIHRIGRTARAGKTGRALSLACEKYVFHLEAVENMLGEKVPVEWFEEDWMVADKAGPVKTTRAAKTARTRKTVPRKKTAAGSPKPKGRPPRWEEKALWADTHPGAFFGFGPPAEKAATSKSTSGKPPEMKAESDEPSAASEAPATKPKADKAGKAKAAPARKQRRRRRKKKASPKPASSEETDTK